MNLILTIISEVGIMDVIDIAIVSLLLYKLYQTLNHTRAIQLIKGVGIFILVLRLSDLAKLRMVNYFLVNLLSFGALALIVIFQPELRRALEYIGRNKFVKISFFNPIYEKNMDSSISSIINSVDNLSKEKTGALIVLEGETGLKDIVETGTIIDSAISTQIIENIFIPKTPLHDGAVIISEDRILAAGCLLPLSSDRSLSRDLGTRHRAALGMSANSDALIIIVSEETGIVSIAKSNELIRHINSKKLEEIITKFYKDDYIN